MNTRLEISLRTIFLTLGIIAGGWLLFHIRDILFLLFIAFLVMTAIHPLVLFLERFRMPRFLSIILIYILVFGLLGASLVGTIPALITQFNKLIQLLPDFTSRVLPYWNIDVNIITQQLAPISENVVRFTFSIFSNIATTMTVLVFTFYFLLERRRAEVILTEVFGETMAHRIAVLLRHVERRLGTWVRGQLLLMLFVGILSYIGLTILKVEFALPLAILAGVLEIVPMIGPIISAIPAIIVALATAPTMFLALSVAALFFIVQQIENNFLVPFVMSRSVGFSPLVTILALMIGGSLAGIAGAVLAVPVLLVVQVVVGDVLAQRQEKAEVAPSEATKNPPSRKK